jgi:hypothetical protein
VNPEAAEAIQPESTVLPDVGHVVRFYPRPGEFGGGRTEFALFVTEVRDGLVKGIVVLDADDFRTQSMLRRRSVDHQWPAWDFIDPPGSDVSLKSNRDSLLDLMELQDKTIALISQRIGDMEARLAALEDKSD